MEKLNRSFIQHYFAFFLFLFINSLLLYGCNSSSSGSTNPGPLAISTSSLPSGQLGAAYSATLVATGGTPPLNWTTTSGTLPAGLKLNASTGAITGTPTATANNLALTFQVQDSGSPQQSKSVNLTLTIAPAALTISTTSLPSGQVGVAYSTTLVASGGTTPYTWTLTSGTLPANLQLNAATGAIAGTPTVSVASTPLTFQVKDSSSPIQSKTVNLALAVAPVTLAISTNSVPNGQVGVAYSTTLVASGGTTPYTWTLTSGALPANLKLNAATGAITGTPTVSVTSTPLTFQVKDAGSPQQSKTVNLTLTITPATLAISTSSVPNGQVGVAYSTTLVASGGTTPYTWTLTSGALPANLKLNAATGAITGTPTVSVTSTPLTFQVKDAGSPQQSKTVNLTLTITPATLAISTSSIPNGQVGVAYSTTLVASGGTTPYSWTLSSGTLPANLQLNAATGAITGTPTVSVTSSPLTFQVKDAGSPQQSKSVNLSLTIISAGSVTVSLSPKRGGLAITQSIPLTATTNDPLGVTWSATAGSFSAQAATTATYVAPSSAGTVTVTATSATDGTTSASATFGVTDLAGVLTYHNDLARDGVNIQEHALTTANVKTATFGKLFACTIDSPAYAQPLWVPNLNIGGGKHNVVFVATSRNTVYAFDGDANPCVKYWSVSLMNAGEIYLNNGDVSSDDIFSDIGIVGTPVIDAATSTLYVVSKSKTNGTSCTPDASCFQRLHALSLVDGSEKVSPANITSAISVPGTGDGSSGGNVPFSTLRENQRPGLVLLNGVVYVAWASHGDNTPYHGWVIGFDKTSLSRVATFNANPNGSDAGIWMGGGAPAADSAGNLYFLTGNGTFDANTGGSDYGDSTVKLSTSGGLSVADYFTPMDQANLSSADRDHGSGGAAILMDPSAGPVAHLLIGGGKSGVLYLLNRDSMGGFNSSSNNVVQSLVVSNNEILATAAIWNNSLYIAAASTPMQQFPFNLTTGQFGSASHSSSNSFGGKGATPSVSASSASANGIVWALDSSAYGTPCCANGPAVLHAYDAANLGTELWNSTQGTGNAAGNAVKFTVPTVANGKVYVGTRGELSVYGLLPN